MNTPTNSTLRRPQFGIRAYGAALFLNILTALLVCAAPIQARADDLSVNLTAQRVAHNADGSESLQSAAQAQPGDTIQYTALYANQSKGIIANLHPTLPIPLGMEYIAGSAHPAPGAASLDGKSFSAIPLMKSVKSADGKEVMQAVPPSDYRALQWLVTALPAGSNVVVLVRVRVATTGLIAIDPSKANAKSENSAIPVVGK